MDPQTPPMNPVEPEQQVRPELDIKQQVVASIQPSKNVLVTVKANPTVDELASALGLTFLLGKQGKHATAVFSGKIPSAMEFLDPDKVFESTVDSLRDFIIALDKEKADKLRYKVEDDVVKVFITPYRTIISEKDLSFSQGDYNVDVVLALGVTQKEQLDKAILSHGKILHDATVVAVTAGATKTSLGSINWNDPEASSIAEMLVALSDLLGGEGMDEQISTALLTGLVAETNRFSNEKTTPRVMNIAAQLMAAGANQQLVATNLRQEGMISQQIRSKKEEEPHDDGGEMVLEHGDKKQTPAKSSNKPPQKTEKAKLSKKAEPLKNEQKSSTASPAEQLKSTVAETAPLNKEPEALTTSGADTPNQESSFTPAAPQHKVIEPLPPVPQASGDTVATPPQEPPSLDVDLTSPATAPLSPVETPSVSTPEGESLEEVRKAVELAAEPADQQGGASVAVPTEPLEPLASEVTPVTTPDTLPSVQFDQESPVDAFMKTQATPNAPADGYAFNTAPQQITPSPTPVNPFPGQAGAPALGGPGDLPPLPPMPGDMSAGGMPPMPPLPGDPMSMGGQVTMQPQMQPDFLQGQSSAPNALTQAGNELAAKRAEKDAANQARRDQLASNYDQAAQRQEELRAQSENNTQQAA